MSRSKVLFENDLERIEHVIDKYAVGSAGAARIIYLTGKLAERGTNAEKILQDELNKKMICGNCRKRVSEICNDGFCRDCHKTITWEDCIKRTKIDKRHLR